MVITIVVVTIVVTVPVTIRVPLAVAAVPPSVIGAPATFAFGIQIMAPLLCLVAAYAVLANRLLKFLFPAFDFTLTSRVGRIGMGRGYDENSRA